MPAHLSHLVFAHELLTEIDRPPTNPLARGLVALGAQGPDLFLHNRRTKPSGLHYGTALHRKRFGSFVAALLRRCRDDGYGANDPITLYALSFATHGVLDRFIHPFVNYFGGWGSPPAGRPHTHAFFERILDSFVIRERWGTEATEYDFYGELAFASQLETGGERALRGNNAGSSRRGDLGRSDAERSAARPGTKSHAGTGTGGRGSSGAGGRGGSGTGSGAGTGTETGSGFDPQEIPEELQRLLSRSLKATLRQATEDDQLDTRLANAYSDAVGFYRYTNRVTIEELRRRFGPYADDPAALKRGLALLHPIHLPEGIDYLNLEKREWLHPCEPRQPRNDSFPELYSAALARGRDVLREMVARYDGNGVAALIGDSDLSDAADREAPCTKVYTDPLPFDRVLESIIDVIRGTRQGS